MGRQMEMIELTARAVSMLNNIYHHTLHGHQHIVSRRQILNQFPADEHDKIDSEITYFINKGILDTTNSPRIFLLSSIGVKVLNQLGIETVISKGVVLNILKNIPLDLNKWISKKEIDELGVKETERELWLAFKILEREGYIETAGSLGRLLPYRLRLTALGRDHQNDIVLFESFIPLNEREFLNRISDEVVFDWINSLHRIENFEIEFKTSLPPDPQLRKTITCMSNGDSGVIFVGIRDSGNIIGIENPDSAKRRTTGALRGYDIDVKFRIIKDQSEKLVLMIMVPSKMDFTPIGSKIYLRKDGEEIELSPAEVIVEYKKKEAKERYGFIFLTSIYQFAMKIGN